MADTHHTWRPDMHSSPLAGRPQDLRSGRELDTEVFSAAALARASHDLMSAAELLGAADSTRESAAALAVALPSLTAALRMLAAATDDLRVDTLWLLRDSEPLLRRRGDVDPVAGAATDFSQVAGRLYASARACASLRDRIEPLLGAIADASVVADEPLDAIGLGAELSRGARLRAQPPEPETGPPA
jgi:hypothetical protein